MERVKIDRLGHRGDGVGGAPPVYVRRALPGEEVEGDVHEGRMASPRILTPSPDRVRPPCPHYRCCGGCDLMHASDGFVEGWKADVVRTALAAHGLPAPIRKVVTSPPGSRRRAVLAGTRTKSGAIVGFHGRASAVVVAVPGCLVLAPAILEALPHLEALTRAGAPRKGEIRLAVTATDTGLDVAVSDAKPFAGVETRALTEIASEAAFARLTWNGETLLQAVAPVVRMGPAEVALPPGAFLQATAEGENALVSAVSETVSGAGRVAELFSGAGTFALPLARDAEVHAVEGEGSLLAALDRGWRHGSGLRRVTTEKRDLFRRPLLRDELARFDAVVIDPPRAGAEAQIAELARAGPDRIASVSCNPATFARDTAQLVAAGYRLDRIDVIDQFRWSPHVELAASLARTKK